MTRKTQMERIINSSYGNIAGMVVYKGGKNVYEKYWNGCTAKEHVHVFSVTKSIISILIGIAIDKGYMQSVDQHVLDFFPDYKVKKGEKTIQCITLKDLMTMTAPYKCKTEPYTEYFASDDWVEAALDLLGGKGKIGEFRYTPLIGPDILSGILVKTTGKPVLEFATDSLFSPLGIRVPGNIIFHNKEEHLAFLEARNLSGWVAGPTGVNTAGWGLMLTAEDMAKIGKLCLNGGLWEGRQIVSAEWIKESTERHSKWEKFFYGYLWWIIEETEHAYAALGDAGNVIYINEKKGLVIAIASLYAANAKDRLKLIREYIEPAFENDIQ